MSTNPEPAAGAQLGRLLYGDLLLSLLVDEELEPEPMISSWRCCWWSRRVAFLPYLDSVVTLLPEQTARVFERRFSLVECPGTSKAPTTMPRFDEIPRG